MEWEERIEEVMSDIEGVIEERERLVKKRRKAFTEWVSKKLNLNPRYYEEYAGDLYEEQNHIVDALEEENRTF